MDRAGRPGRAKPTKRRILRDSFFVRLAIGPHLSSLSVSQRRVGRRGRVQPRARGDRRGYVVPLLRRASREGGRGQTLEQVGDRGCGGCGQRFVEVDTVGDLNRLVCFLGSFLFCFVLVSEMQEAVKLLPGVKCGLILNIF